MLVVFRKHFLLLSIILLILPALVAPSSPSNDTRLLNNINMEDYTDEDEDDEDVTSKPPAPKPAAEQCNYSLCLDKQPSCQQLEASTGCSCPGMSGPWELPDPPHLRRLSQDGSGRVVAHWCAPTSTVTHYLVWVEGWDVQQEIGQTRRQMDLGDVADGAEVCVQAVNRAGESSKAKHSCTRFHSQSSESGLALRLGIIGGVVALVVVLALALALLLWRLRTRRKRKARAETSGGDGVL